MRILAIESASLVASAAVLDGDVIKAEYTACNGLTHSQTLLPMIDEVMKTSGIKLEELDAIAISAGPGSFTGLRIGAATAKGLGLALDKPLIAVPTLAATAFNLYGSEKIICPIMDARRKQVYNGLYSFLKYDSDATKPTEMEFLTMMDSRVLSLDELLRELAERDHDVIFLGDGVPVYKDAIIKKLGKKATFAPAHLDRQRAASVALLASQMLANGEIIAADDFAPEYLRKSQAEREAEEGINAAEDKARRDEEKVKIELARRIIKNRKARREYEEAQLREMNYDFATPTEYEEPIYVKPEVEEEEF